MATLAFRTVNWRGQIAGREPRVCCGIKPEAKTFLNEVEKLPKTAEKTGQPLSPVQEQLYETTKPTIEIVTKAEAEEVQKKLVEAGATVELK